MHGKPEQRSQPFDLRHWIEEAKSLGQLKEVEGADLKFEVGCITDLNATRGGPSLLFKNFKGYNSEFRVLTGSMMNVASLGVAMGFDGKLTNLEAVDKVAEILRSCESNAKDFTVEYVDNGDAVDMTIFPTPTWHELDGGAYIGTGGWQVHRDPESD